MSTDIETPQKAPKQPELGFIVLHDGRPCALANLFGSWRKAVLLPGAPVKCFKNRRQARRAIQRAKRTGVSLKGTCIDSWEKIAPLFAPTGYKAVEIQR